MAIFDSKKKHYLTFHCHLADPVEIDTAVNPKPVGFPAGSETTVKALQAAFPTGMNAAPITAAALLSAPFRGYEEPNEVPAVWTEWYGDDAGGPYPTNVSKFERRTGGFLGIGGTTVTYYWMGDFVLSDGEDGPTVDGEVVPVDEQGEFLKRRWIEGFETPTIGACTAASASGLSISRDASRHVGGLGLAYRGASNTISNIQVQKYDAGNVDAKSWERMYLRLRKKPSANTPMFWRSHGSPSALVGAALGITTTGHIAAYSSDAVGTYALLTTSPVALTEWTGAVTHNAWAKLDILLEYDVPKLRVFLKGVEIINVALPTTQTRHLSSDIGNSEVLANDLQLDIDDWVCSDIPTRVGVEALTGKDWLNGTKIVLIRPQQYSANHNAAAWTGDFRTLMQNGAGGFAPPTVGSSTSAALMAVDTDADIVVGADPGMQGVAAILVCLYSTRGAASGELGYSLAGAAAVMTAITQGAALTANQVLYSPNTSTALTDAPDLPDVLPIELRHTKGAGADAATVATLLAQVEMIGLFGPEDYRDSELDGLTDPVPRGTGVHNAPYPRSQWAREALAGPISPYIVHGGTYVGNSTGQDLTFRAPVHWFFVRPLTGNAGGFFWLSSMLGAHRSFQEGIECEVVNAEEDSTFVPSAGDDAQQQRYRIRIAGSDTQLNATGVTYQYIAIMDPGMRYMLNGSFAAKTTEASVAHKLVATDRLPEFAFLFPERLNTTTTNRLYAKGPGQAAETIVNFAPGTVATALAFVAGQLTTKANLHTLAGGAHCPFSLWRKQDGNKDSGEPGVVNFGSYIGDGAASRTITLSPSTVTEDNPDGRRPLFAMVFAESGVDGYWRDPSHTSTNSNKHGGTEGATGITAGAIDQMTVGVALNGAGIVYTYFVLYADEVAGNNGWGTNGEHIPVEAAAPIGSPWPDDPPDPEGVSSSVTPLVGEPDLDTETTISSTASFIWGQLGGSVCEVYTRALVNRALKHLGINKRVANLATDETEEAIQARDVTREAINTVLRDFPWPFATGYADLVLVDGEEDDPVNKDWTYSYRAPTGMMFARRIVPQAGEQRAHNSKPIQFRLGTDTTGPLIFTNEAIPDDGTLVLEYTIRVTCPAFYGDPLFRDACSWKIAAELAQPLSRDSKKQEFCLGMYRSALRNAAAPAANEQQPAEDGDADWIAGRN